MITAPKERPEIVDNKKLNVKYEQFKQLISELNKKDLTQELIDLLNAQVEALNNEHDVPKGFKRQLTKSRTKIIQLGEKKMKIVPQGHYRNMWLAVGMAAFGIPFGVVFGFALGSMAFIGLGFPIGLGIGIAIGTQMDKKAQEEGRQLDWELKM